jgi:hypothetical protein
MEPTKTTSHNKPWAEKSRNGIYEKGIKKVTKIYQRISLSRFCFMPFFMAVGGFLSLF